MKIYLATAEYALGSYSIDAVAETPEAAVKLCIATVRRERKRLGLSPWEYEEDVQALELTVGRAHLDLGRAGVIA